MVRVNEVGRVRRWTRAMAVVAALAFTSSCFDRSTTDTIAPGHARLALVPRFATVPGGPSIVMTRLEASLTSEFGDSTFAKADFVDGTAKLTFEFGSLALRASSSSTSLVLMRKGSSCTTPGEATRSRPATTTIWPNPNSSMPGLTQRVTTIHVAPGPMTLDAGATTTLSVNGTDASNILVSAIRVGGPHAILP